MKLKEAIKIINEKIKEVDNFSTNIDNWSLPNFDDDFLEAINTILSVVKKYNNI